MNEFIPFPKMVRLSREIIITEKIDGTNASVFIGENGEFLVGSRTRWITPESDNFGFARWCEANQEELMKLGPGHHFGEWWGNGIQRGYGRAFKSFSLFNTSRWKDATDRPICCEVVPELFVGEFTTDNISKVLEELSADGSKAAPGFTNPEGIVIYHTAARIGFKKTIKDDEKGKGQ